jgi:hypothetical protein
MKCAHQSLGGYLQHKNRHCMKTNALVGHARVRTDTFAHNPQVVDPPKIGRVSDGSPRGNQPPHPKLLFLRTNTQHLPVLPLLFQRVERSNIHSTHTHMEAMCTIASAAQGRASVGRAQISRHMQLCEIILNKIIHSPSICQGNENTWKYS